MQNQILDLVAKLLANENINVVRAAVATAAFDIANRTLILPQWKEMTPAIDQMLVAHEVSHALFTTSDYTEALKTRLTFKTAASYLNILEDVRVEKHMKRKYPGLRKVFHTGYAELNDMDFFSVRSRDLTTAHLMDRINLYFKVGFGVVNFSADEKPFVVRAENLETLDETIQLAEDIYKFLKERGEQAQLSQEQGDVESSEPDSEFDDGDTDHSFDSFMSPADSSEGEGKGNESDDESRQSSNMDEDGTQEGDQDDPSGRKSSPTVSDNVRTSEADEAPVTNRSFEQRVSELADTNTTYKYWTIAPKKVDHIVSHKEITKEINHKYDFPITESDLNVIRKFKQDTQNNVDYLVKEFEMRKSATAYKRAMTSKVGSLNMNKVWAYKLNDDLFKRVTTVKQGKNHGMVFLLDWSGSMNNVINDTIEQVINLAMFCQRAGIAFEVFAFTDSYRPKGLRNAARPTRVDNVIDVNYSSFALLQLLSHRMNATEFNTMVNNLKTRRVQRTFELNGTPLNESLVYMYDYIEEFQRENNVEKTTFITLTDGEGGRLPIRTNETEWSPNYTSRRVRHFIRDKYTKKNLELRDLASCQTSTLITMIKERYQCAVLGFYITRNLRHDLVSTIHAHYSQMNRDQVSGLVDTMKSDFRTRGYSSLFNTGRDELFVVPTSEVRVQYEQLTVDKDSSARAIATKFGKYMTAKKTSRVLLNKFIGYVA